MASTPDDYSSGSDSSLITEQVKQGTQQLAQQTQDAAGQAMEQAKGHAQGMLQSRKSQATENLNSMADALRQTGESLRTQNQEPVANMTDTVAQRIEGMASWLDQRDMNELMWEAERYARQNPIVVLGGAFLLGVAAARFLKSSSQPSGDQGGYAGGYGRYGATYGAGYRRSMNGGDYDRDSGSVAGGHDSEYSSHSTGNINSYGAVSERPPTGRFSATGAYSTDTPDLSTETMDVTGTAGLGTDDGTSSRSH